MSFHITDDWFYLWKSLFHYHAIANEKCLENMKQNFVLVSTAIFFFIYAQAEFQFK